MHTGDRPAACPLGPLSTEGIVDLMEGLNDEGTVVAAIDGIVPKLERGQHDGPRGVGLGFVGEELFHGIVYVRAEAATEEESTLARC